MGNHYFFCYNSVNGGDTLQNNEYIKMLELESMYFEDKFNYEFGDEISKDVINNTFMAFYSNEEYINILSKVKNISEDFIKYSKIFRYKLMYVIASNHLFNLNDINATFKENDPTYYYILAQQSLSALLNEDFNKLEVSSLFLANPAINNITSILRIINNNIKDRQDDIISLELKHIIDSLYSMIILINNKCYPQAMSVFRQALEQYITVVALFDNPNALPSFLNHQAITIKDATKSLTAEELAKYIEDNNLTYNNYKSYMNYGWLDEVKAFRDLKEKKPNTKYSIKTVAMISNSMSFYDAMDFASNYVHSNFVFLNLNWDLVIKEVLDGVYQILDWLIDIYKNINKDFLIIEGYNYELLYNSIKERALRVISDDEYKFNIR